MDLGIKNKVAFITGASSGIGLATAELFAKEGAKVIICGRNEVNLKKAKDEIKKSTGNEVDFFSCDTSKFDNVEKVVNKIEEKYKKIDILINNAGKAQAGGVVDAPDEAWKSMIDVKIYSLINTCKTIAPIMKKNNWGRITTITSTIVKEPSPEMILSATSRGGLSSFTKAIAIENAKFNISANVISPGGIMTERFINLIKIAAKKEKKNFNKKLLEVEKSIPAKRVGRPDEIANAIVFLSSDLGGYINGIDLSIDGAFTKGF